MSARRWLSRIILAAALPGCILGAAPAGPAAGQASAIPDKPAAETPAAASAGPASENPASYNSRRFVRHLSNTETCLACHGNFNPVVRDKDGKPRSLWIDSQLFFQSAHARFGCQSCHTNIDGFGHRAVGVASGEINCAPCHAVESKNSPAEQLKHQQRMEERAGFDRIKTVAIRACINCHKKEYEQNSKSIHGQSDKMHGVEGVPFCINCHGMHYILSCDVPRSATNPINVPSTCLNCHAQTDVKLRAGLTLVPDTGASIITSNATKPPAIRPVRAATAGLFTQTKMRKTSAKVQSPSATSAACQVHPAPGAVAAYWTLRARSRHTIAAAAVPATPASTPLPIPFASVVSFMNSHRSE